MPLTERGRELAQKILEESGVAPGDLIIQLPYDRVQFKLLDSGLDGASAALEFYSGDDRVFETEARTLAHGDSMGAPARGTVKVVGY